MRDEGLPSEAAASTIRVSDLVLATYLICRGARLVGVAPTPDPKRKDFLLKAQPDLMETATYWFSQGGAWVEPRQYEYARRLLRRALVDW